MRGHHGARRKEYGNHPARGGYGRVSTNEEEPQNSFEAQVDYYTKYIQAHAGWELVEVYCDEGITGTSTKKRDGFNRMIEDALAGKFTLIVTKSVSRFARNTVDSLQTIRKLRRSAARSILRRKTSGPSTARANCC